jgi:hypothetical protein
MTEKQRGGPGRGQGRKKEKETMSRTYDIEVELVEKMKPISNKNKFVNQAIRDKFEKE